MKFLFVFLSVLFFLFSCSNTVEKSLSGGEDAGTDVDGDNEPEPSIPPEWYEPDELGRTTLDNRMGQQSEMVILSDGELAPVWRHYAGLRQLEGIATEVVVIEDIVAEFPGADDAEKVQNFLKERHSEGSLRWVLLGGDTGRVPFRRVDNAIYVPFEEYTSNAPSEMYFANILATWDANGNGKYGEMNMDFSLATARESQLAVGRVPADTEEEVLNYLNKVVFYRTHIPGFAQRSALMTDVASTLPLIGDIDAAEGVESTFDAFFPQGFHQQVQKLYTTSTAISTYGAQKATVDSVRAALESNVSLVFHNGHGSHRWMTDLINRDFVNDLTNELPNVFASCSCLSGNFADVANTGNAPWQPQEPDQDSAGERYVLGPHGGVAYIGNTAVGLGPIGGSQFLHAFFKGMFVEEIPSIGEIFNYGRLYMRSIPYSLSVLQTTMTDDSEWWTHHVLILLGDPSLSPWTQDPLQLTIQTPETYGPGYQTLTVGVEVASGGSRQGIAVSFHKEDDFWVTLYTDANGQVSFSFIPRGPGVIHVGATGPNLSFAHKRIFPDLPPGLWTPPF